MVESESHALDPAARIRTTIEENHEALLRSVAVLVAHSDRRLAWSDVMEIAAEILSEAVHEALKDAGRFDPARSVTAWVRGIAAKRLLNRRRQVFRGRRCVAASVLGDEAWLTVLGQLCTGPAEGLVNGRLDLEQALSRISAEERLAIEYRYYQGLDGNALATALGVPTTGAARVRVCRALAALRSHLVPAEAEALP